MDGTNLVLIGAIVMIIAGLLIAVWLVRQRRSTSIGTISAKETLEAMIPAIMDIERGYHEHVHAFIMDANKSLEQLGSPYRFTSTYKTKRSWDVTGEYVDTISVIETSMADDRDQRQ